MVSTNDLLRRPALFGAASVLFACLQPLNAGAAVALAFSTPQIVGEGWQAGDITIDVRSDGAGVLALAIRIARVRLPDASGELRDVELACPQVTTTAGWQCAEGRLTVSESPAGRQETGWSGAWQTDGALSLEVPTLRLAGGELSLTLQSEGAGWRLGGRAYRLRLAPTAALTGLPQPPADWGSSGRISGNLTVEGTGAELARLQGDLVVDGLSYASPDGTQAAENLVLKVDTTARASATAWRFDARLGWPKGALYVDPLFHDAATGALTVEASGRFQPDRHRLGLDSWTVVLDQTFKVSGTALFDTRALDIRDMTIAAHSGDAGRLYDLLLQPFLIGTPADDMAMEGQVGFVLHFDAEGFEQAGLQLSDLAFADRRQRFALDRTSGSVAWDRDAGVPVSRLSTQGVTLLGVETGAFDVRMRLAADRVDLVEPVVVPVLGGEVALDRFELTGAELGGADPRWTASASVRQVSLERLTRELAWPPFSGNLAGELRDMRYADQVFTIGGGLRLAAFDGEIRVDGLRIANPLGAVPVLGADATLRGLNLEAVTRTFAFGRIEGRLDGDLDDLRLVAWEPDRFDLHLYTPPDDDSRHRISQRAVENLTELGSGLPAGLSASFLRIFDEFNYDAIDVKIALRGNAARIDGLARKDGGYYLVRGSGLPRIDVIGRNRSVAWTDLLERLREIQVEGVEIR